ncbi:universal stress protein [Leptobacterium sp. I13]|uniref:universal stress protein n=1 Tax=Leptobacterium meishanense TaxID=3128904 RepID=UPI0030ECBC61
MKKILVPTDFSTPAAHALKVAAQLAKKHHAEIYLFHALELPVHLATTNTGKIPEAVFYMKLAHQKFEGLKKEPFLKDITIHETIDSGTAHSGITETIKKNAIDIVVMGSTGASGLKEMFVGSNAEKIIRTCEVPVLIIKKEHENFNINNIVIASDFSSTSQKNLNKGVALMTGFEGTVHFLYVNTPHLFLTTLEAEHQMKAVIDKTGMTNYTSNIFNDVSVERGILNFSQKINADLICLGTHGRKGLAHFFNGSIGEDLANHAMRPVMTYRI